MKVTLGGDRLGSGKKQKVEMHGFERSTHNLSMAWRSTMAVGTLVPFMNEVALPGDTWDINLDAYVNTHPTLGPLFGSMKVQLDVFITPMRLYNAWLHNNRLKVGMSMADIKLPKIILPAKDMPTQYDDTIDLDNWQVNPSCILKYLGIGGIGNNDGYLVNRQFNATGLVNYWDIYKNYYANKQEEVGVVIHTPYQQIIATVDFVRRFSAGVLTVVPQFPSAGSVTFILGDQIRIYYDDANTAPDPTQVNITDSTGETKTAQDWSVGVWTTVNAGANSYLWSAFRQTMWGNRTFTQWDYIPDGYTGEPGLETFPLENIDTMRDLILNGGNGSVQITDTSIEPYGFLCQNSNGVNNMEVTMEGLGIKTYQSDIFNNWINTAWIDGVGGITDLTSIDTSGGSFSLDTLNLSRKIYDLLNRVAVAGGSYGDWVMAAYDHESYLRTETPMYMGGLAKEIVFQEVISNAGTSDQPLGTLGGRGTLSNKHKGGNIYIKVNEPSYIMGIVSITPRIDYSQGNRWDVHLDNIDELHKPSLDEIGFQETSTEQICWWDTKWDGLTTWQQNSMGKQPAWINYMTNYNRTYGNFAKRENEMFMTLNRRYEAKQNTGWAIKDLTTYIDPSKYNFIFAETSLDAQNFWVQIGVDMEVRRKMSAKIMPML